MSTDPERTDASAATPEDALTWWFGDWDDSVPLTDDDPELRRWWQANADDDNTIRERFGALHAEVVAGEHDDWEETPRGALAKVILLDQFSRAMHRGTAKAFAGDDLARATTQRSLERAFDRDLDPIERLFLYMPLMHSEESATHRKALALFTAIAEEIEEAGLARADYYRGNVRYEVQHKEIIDRFGRYPHRNGPLERTMTPEEMDWLRDEGGNPFG